jgi:hypothetical protein
MPMALIDCPECGSEVSSSAASCLRCAYPIASSGRVSPAVAERPLGPVMGNVLDVTKEIVGRLALAGVFLASGIVWEAPPVILGSLVIVVSTVPIWVRAKRVAKFGGTADSRRVADLEQRLLELEERTSHQLADVEEVSARQIAELEDRLDFTERLLMARREPA